jgi:hypothetical protein
MFVNHKITKKNAEAFAFLEMHLHPRSLYIYIYLFILQLQSQLREHIFDPIVIVHKFLLYERVFNSLNIRHDKRRI